MKSPRLEVYCDSLENESESDNEDMYFQKPQKLLVQLDVRKVEPIVVT
jgi:hypothetical protein